MNVDLLVFKNLHLSCSSRVEKLWFHFIKTCQPLSFLKMSKFTEAIEVMKRIEKAGGTEDGKMPVQGTFIMDEEEIIHSSFDNSTTFSISRSLVPLTEACSNCIRTIDPSDKVEFVRINFSDLGKHSEVLLAPDGEFQAVVLQAHKIRDLRKRSFDEPKGLKSYRYDQQNLFFPSLDGVETLRE